MSETQDKVQKQIEMELEAIDRGVQRYRQSLINEPFADLPPGVALLKMAIQPMSAALRAFLITPVNSRYVTTAATKEVLRLLDADVVAYIVARRIISGFGQAFEKSPLQTVAISIADMLRDQLEYQQFRSEHPGFLYRVEQNLKRSTAPHRRRVISHAKTKLGVQFEKWSEVDRLQLGVKLLDLFIASTGMVDRVPAPATGRRGKTPHFLLAPSAAVLGFIKRANAKCELLAPFNIPMIVPPKPWGGLTGGGYLAMGKRADSKLNGLVKIKRSDKEHTSLTKADMPLVYQAVNALQAVPYRINKRVFEVMQAVWDGGGVLGGLPAREPEPLPAKTWMPGEEPAPDELKAWKRKAAVVYERNIRVRSKRLAVESKLSTINHYHLADEPEIFFPHNMDWRGRVYPLPTYINPQADDTGRALIEFAKGVALGERGAFWLAIHGANCFGVDKVSFEERAKWVEENVIEILESASNPLDGARFWCEAENPYQFLAFCFEWSELIHLGSPDVQPYFVSHLPIGLDGSCNGLQNFSAMLRDEVGGAATNLLPSPTPRDIYQEVANVLNKMVAEDAANGSAEARIWLGKITRKVTKRGVMTTPYGAKKYGLKEQLRVELAKIDPHYLGVEDDFPAIAYLGNRLYDAIGQVVIAARQAMDWLHVVARVAAKGNLPVRWTTPAGFTPVQDYREQDLIQVKTFFGGICLRLGLQQPTEKLNKRKQASGISPNFVHSMDASHLMLTIDKCLKNSVTDVFAMVHDSYATHAGTTDGLAWALREAFIEQYSQDVLENFRKEVVAQLPPGLAEEIPPLPASGSLDLAKVRDSRYFFA